MGNKARQGATGSVKVESEAEGYEWVLARVRSGWDVVGEHSASGLAELSAQAEREGSRDRGSEGGWCLSPRS